MERPSRPPKTQGRNEQRPGSEVVKKSVASGRVAGETARMNDTLFPLPTANEPHEPDRGQPRVQRPNRTQLEWRAVDLEGLLPADHRARVVWEFVEGLDLTPLYTS